MFYSLDRGTIYIFRLFWGMEVFSHTSIVNKVTNDPQMVQLSVFNIKYKQSNKENSQVSDYRVEFIVSYIDLIKTNCNFLIAQVISNPNL